VLASKTVKWSELVVHAPTLAQQAQRILESHPHHVLATTKQDGSPRLGGTNVFFTEGELWIGAMPTALRNGDLRREPRCAIHSAPLDENLQIGDVRLELVAQELIDREAMAFLNSADQKNQGVVFLLRVGKVSVVRVEKDELIIEIWDPVNGGRTVRLN
jgi:hypothetical protein